LEFDGINKNNMQKLKQAIQEIGTTSLAVTLALVLFFGISIAKGWVEPIQTPPNGNVGTPINTSFITQIKQGAFGVQGLFAAFSGIDVATRDPNTNAIIATHNITGVATPVDGTDAVNKDYVDAAGGGSSWLFLTNYAECGSSACDAIAGVDCGTYGMVVAGYYGRAEKKMDIDGDPIAWWHVMTFGAISNELPSGGSSISCTSPVVLGTTQKVSCTMRNGDSSWNAFSGVAVICSK
jgi:hypothetical protein